jgi:hypothetical protein
MNDRPQTATEILERANEANMTRGVIYGRLQSELLIPLLKTADFKIDIPVNILRKMTRKQYYQAMSYLRLVRKKLILYRER